MRLVDNHQIIISMRNGGSTGPAKPLEAQEICSCLRRGKSVSPHRGERRGRNDENVRILTRYRCRDECLAHADIVREQRPAKLFDRCLESRDCGLLMWFQCDPAESRARFRRSEHQMSDSCADAGRRL